MLAAAALSLIAVGTALGATFAGAATSPDLLFFWGPKAQQFALARSFDAAFMRDEFHQHMHAYYPPLVTNLGAFASMAAGRMSWTGATLTFPLLLVFLAAGLPGALADRLGRAHAAAVAALTIAVISCLGVEADIAGNGEMPLLLFETLAIALLLSEAAAGRRRNSSPGFFSREPPRRKSKACPSPCPRPRCSSWPGLAPRGPSGPRPPGSYLPAAVMLSAWFAFGAADGSSSVIPATGRSSISITTTSGSCSPRWAALSATGHALPWLVPLVCVLAALPLTHRWILSIGTAAILTAFFLFTYIHRPEDPSLWISWSAARVFSPVAMLLALAASLGSRGERRLASP